MHYLIFILLFSSFLCECDMLIRGTALEFGHFTHAAGQYILYADKILYLLIQHSCNPSTP